MKILILRPDHIGDMILTTPFIASLRNGLPEAKISILCGSWSVPVLKNNPYNIEIIKCNYPWLARSSDRSWKEFLSVILQLRKRKFDIIFNLRKALREAVWARVIGAEKIYGFDISKSSWTNTHKVHYNGKIHIADLYLELIRDMGIEPVHNGMELFFDQDEISEYEEKFKKNRPYVIIAPATPDPNRLWLPERWAEIADWIIKDLKLPVFMIGTESDKPVINSVIANMKEKAENLSGKLPLRATALLIKEAEFVVSVNSAPVHIACAVKTPAAGLYGPNNPKHWGPYANGKANQSVSRIETFKYANGAHNDSGGFELITTEDVKESIIKLCSEESINVNL
ncbi:glycosyltransferase family 9 protein [candidate division KSB1 bacterium]